MDSFVGRRKQLDVLKSELAAVSKSGRGRFLALRGRRRVGKSRLVDEFLQRSKARYVFFQAPRRERTEALAYFATTLAESNLPVGKSIEPGLNFQSWQAAFRLAIQGASKSHPIVIVIDELPYLLANDPSFDADLQHSWDRDLQNNPVLLIIIGSDISMMQHLSEYGQALHGRPTKELVIPPFNPQETGELLQLPTADLFDAYLVVGGLPLIAAAWKPEANLNDYLTDQLTDPTAPLIVNGERMLSGEFPKEVGAQQVLQAIGSGERTFSNIQAVTKLPPSSLSRSLKLLIEQKQLVRTESPLSKQSSRNTRYSIQDPYLRFWLRFIAPYITEVERGRGSLLIERIRHQWPDYRGRAIESLIRDSIELSLPNKSFDEALYVGSYWTRNNEIEIDLVGAEKTDHPKRIAFIGSIKWREHKPFTHTDLHKLVEMRAQIPGVDDQTKLVGVSRSGFTNVSLDVQLTPTDLLKAWAH